MHSQSVVSVNSIQPEGPLFYLLKASGDINPSNVGEKLSKNAVARGDTTQSVMPGGSSIVSMNRAGSPPPNIMLGL